MDDIHNVTVLSFVNECRCPILFSNYYHVREAGYDLGWNGRLHVPLGRTDIGQICILKDARLWNNKFNLVNQHLYKNNFRTTITKCFIETYQYFFTSCCIYIYIYIYIYIAVVIIWYLYALCRTKRRKINIWLKTNHSYRECNTPNASEEKIPGNPQSILLFNSSTIVNISVVSSEHLGGSLATDRGTNLWNECQNVVHMKCALLWSSGNEITATTA